ncbi:MAG: hypothetical protein JJE04_09285 [Acidobacteriia bacterium]|nr:hypothetical protein [Terriglobia bacterium]
MPKFELIKTIEARKLNKRSRLPLNGPPSTIPYAAIVDDVVRDRDNVAFTHLGELYQCSYSVFAGAMGSTGEEDAVSVAPEAEGSAAEPAEKVKEQRLDGPRLVWAMVNSPSCPVARAKVPGGWLVASGKGASASIAFYPDTRHEWDGGSLD